MEPTQTAAGLAAINSEAGKELTHRAGEIFSKLLGPVSEQLGLTLGDYAAYYRLKRLVALGEKAQKLLRGRTISASPNLGRILPIIQVASMENDEDLHSRWAALLANALHNPSSVHPSYLEILKQLTPDEARWLDRAADEAKEDHIKFTEKFQREHPRFASYDRPTNWHRVPREMTAKATVVMLGNLERLGLVRHDLKMEDEDVVVEHGWLQITDFGKAFIQACRESSV